MKKYHLNNKEMRYWCSKVRKYLNLPPIKLKIRVVEDAYDYASVAFHPYGEFKYGDPTSISLAQPNKKLSLNMRSYRSFYDNFSNKNYIIFTIFHEFAHYFQWYHHRK